MLIKIPGDKWKRLKSKQSFQQNQYNYIKMYIFNDYGYKLAEISLRKIKTKCFLWYQLAACFCIRLTKCSASCELWYPDELLRSWHSSARAEQLPLALPEAGLSLGIRTHRRLAQTWVGSKGSSGSHEQLTLQWRLAWSVQSETQFHILGKMKWLFFQYILLTQNIRFLTLLSVFILVRKCEKLTFFSLWRIRQTSKQWKHKLFSSIITC